MHSDKENMTDVLDALAENQGLIMKEAEHTEDETARVLFPVEALGNPVFVELANQWAAQNQIPVQLYGLQMLGTVSAAVGRSFVLDRPTRRGIFSRGNTFILGVAPSSCGKDLSSVVVAPIFAFERQLREEFEAVEMYENQAEVTKANNVIKSRKSSPDELAEAHKIVSETPLSAHKLIQSNVTSEALSGIMLRSHETVFLFSTEGGDMVRNFIGQYKSKGGDFTLYNAAWSGSYVSYERVLRGNVCLYSPCLSMFVAIQPNFFDELTADKEAMHTGFLPRVLAFDTEITYTHDDGVYRSVDEDLIAAWDQLITGILNARIKGNRDHAENSDQVINVPCSGEAREVFRLFYNRMQDRRSQEPDLSTMLGKACENATRVSLLLSIMGASWGADIPQMEVTQEHALNACRIVEWCLESTFRMMQRARANNLERDAEKLYQTLCLPDYDGQATLRDLTRRNGFKADRIRQLAEWFPKRFELVEIKPENSGRPSKVVRLTE